MRKTPPSLSGPNHRDGGATAGLQNISDKERAERRYLAYAEREEMPTARKRIGSQRGNLTGRPRG